MDRFREILNELGDLLDLPLYPDRLGACKLNMEDKCHVQIEYQPHKQRLLLACMICEIPPGKFRENVFKEALKTNAVFPNQGSFSYLVRNQQLAIWHELPYYELTKEQLSKQLFQFIEKADLWRSCLENGSLQLVAQEVRSRLPSPMMGLR